MFKQLLKKLALAAILVCMVFAVAAASACNAETKHPKVRITVEFNSQKYELNYTLYRNMYPNTVRRFIELADRGYYKDMLVHDYRANDWLSGGYDYVAAEYDAAAEIDSITEYLQGHSKEQEFLDLFDANKITPTVYKESAYDKKNNRILVKDSALPTLIGEFYNNINQEIENGALTAELGTLKMFYYEKESTGKVHVDTRNKQKEIIFNADYKTNCATTIFAMQVGSGSEYGESNYCVFGKMDSTSKLIALLDDISDYYDGDDVKSVSAKDVRVDNLVERFSDKDGDKGKEVNFTLSKQPIIIRSVKVTKH